jgi:outer membrane protein assembly factor BamB
VTTPSDHLHTLTCPTCGAPLEINVTEPVIHCQYCNSNVENPEYHPPQPSAPPVVIQMDHPTHYPPAVKKRSPVAGLIVTLGILSVVSGVIIYIIYSVVSGNGINLFPLQVRAPALLLGRDSAAPILVASTYDTNSENYGLAKLDMTTHKVLWSALPQKDYPSIDAMLAGDTLLYLVIDNRLVALQLSDGKQAWEASLPDTLHGSCPSCLQLEKGQLLVLTTDNSLGAYDAVTGHQTWEKQFDSTQSKLYPTGDGVGLLYSLKVGSALGIFDAVTGDETTHLEPTCEPANGFGDEMGTYSNVVFDPASQPAKVYIFYGLFNACVQRWDISSGTMDWQYLEEDQSLDTSNDIPVLLADGTLYYVQGYQLRSLDAATGSQTRTLADTQDYEFVPLMVSGDRLLVRATRTKGSTRYELWGYDLATGKNLWKDPLLKSSPLDPPGNFSGLIDSDQSAWTYQTIGGKLWLITFQTQPNQVNLAQLNLDTGEQSGQATLPLPLGSDTDFYAEPDRIASSDSLAWFVLESDIYALDVQTGKFTYRWP